MTETDHFSTFINKSSSDMSLQNLPTNMVLFSSKELQSIFAGLAENLFITQIYIRFHAINNLNSGNILSKL